MRLCADPTSPFYRLPHVNIARVFLDGNELRDVLELDTSEGWLIRNCRDENGNFVSEDAENIKTEKLHGQVMIVLPESGGK